MTSSITIQTAEGVLPYTGIVSNSSADQSGVLEHMKKILKKDNSPFVAIDIEMSPLKKEILWIGATNGLFLWMFWIDKECMWKYIFEEILISKHVTKIFHDYDADLIMLESMFKILSRPTKIIDTQLIAKLKGDPLSLELLGQMYNVGVKENVSDNHRYLWSCKVLSQSEVTYLGKDVSITFKLARAILCYAKGVNRKIDFDLEKEYYNVVRWLINNTNARPLKVGALLAGLKNNSPIAKMTSGDKLNELADRVLEMLVDRRVVTIINKSNVLYTFSDELEKKANLMMVNKCLRCEVLMERPQSYCSECIDLIPVYNWSCDSCKVIKEYYERNPVICSDCERWGLKDSCGTCLLLRAKLDHEGFKCGQCYANYNKIESVKEPIDTKQEASWTEFILPTEGIIGRREDINKYLSDKMKVTGQIINETSTPVASIYEELAQNDKKAKQAEIDKLVNKAVEKEKLETSSLDNNDTNDYVIVKGKKYMLALAS